MSKGSGRRPSSLTDQEWTNRWDAIFGRDLDKKEVIKDIMANVATNDTSQKRVDKTSEIVHEAQRTWVGLTDEEVNKLVDDEDWYNDPHEFSRIVEAKIRGKNDAS